MWESGGSANEYVGARWERARVFWRFFGAFWTLLQWFFNNIVFFNIRSFRSNETKEDVYLFVVVNLFFGKNECIFKINFFFFTTHQTLNILFHYPPNS